jgi:hypothetical protein
MENPQQKKFCRPTAYIPQWKGPYVDRDLDCLVILSGQSATKM